MNLHEQDIVEQRFLLKSEEWGLKTDIYYKAICLVSKCVLVVCAVYFIVSLVLRAIDLEKCYLEQK